MPTTSGESIGGVEQLMVLFGSVQSTGFVGANDALALVVGGVVPGVPGANGAGEACEMPAARTNAAPATPTPNRALSDIMALPSR